MAHLIVQMAHLLGEVRKLLEQRVDACPPGVRRLGRQLQVDGNLLIGGDTVREEARSERRHAQRGDTVRGQARRRHGQRGGGGGTGIPAHTSRHARAVAGAGHEGGSRRSRAVRMGMGQHRRERSRGRR